MLLGWLKLRLHPRLSRLLLNCLLNRILNRLSHGLLHRLLNRLLRHPSFLYWSCLLNRRHRWHILRLCLGIVHRLLLLLSHGRQVLRSQRLDWHLGCNIATIHRTRLDCVARLHVCWLLGHISFRGLKHRHWLRLDLFDL